MTSRLRRLLLMLALVLAPICARAHEVRPAYFQVTQDGPHHYEVTWKQPTQGNMALRLIPRLSNGWLNTAPRDQFASGSFFIRTWSITAPQADPLSGATLSIEGLDRSITDVLVVMRLAEGRELESIIRPDHPSLQLAFATTQGLPVPAYLRLGIEHILTGVDHLMFVLGQLLLVGIRWRLVKAITAFTVAHSITLGASAVGLVTVPSAVVEALVALSIVFVASELIRSMRGQSGLTQRWPWVIAFTFGLLHGFAFAGALAEVGLPKNAIPLSLLMFNLGVEIGQLMFVGAAILVILALRKVWKHLPQVWARLCRPTPAYAIGSFAAYWFIERVVIAFQPSHGESTGRAKTLRQPTFLLLSALLAGCTARTPDKAVGPSRPQAGVDQPAAYYVRVLEIPTPRWTTLLAVRRHLPLPTKRAATIQERAWASPIWYTPTRAAG